MDQLCSPSKFNNNSVPGGGHAGIPMLPVKKPSSNRPSKHGWFAWDPPKKKWRISRGWTWDVGKHVKISRGGVFLKNMGISMWMFFCSTWDVHWKGLIWEDFLGTCSVMLAACTCWMTMKNAKRWWWLMDFLFVLVTSCYPNWQNVINRQPVYNQKTQTVLRICGDRKRFQFNQWKKNMTLFTSKRWLFGSTTMAMSPQCKAWRSLAYSPRSTLPTTPHFSPLGGRLWSTVGVSKRERR